MADNTKSKGRQKFEPIQKPATVSTFSPKERADKINEICAGFVAGSAKNKTYYRVIIERLWPVGHGLPGPHVTQDSIRDAINAFRKASWPAGKPYKDYVDVFRRVRELQGEEGLKGVAILGKTYQLVSLELSEKRAPRTKLSDADWATVKSKYGNVCASCKRAEPEVRFQQDHKIPRTRGGQDGIDNWQPLCDECNNFKSVSCRSCELKCSECCWAYPEKYRPIRLSKELLLKLNEYCQSQSLDTGEFAEKTILKAIE